MAQIFNRLGQLGVGLAVAGGVVQSALFNVDGGHRAVIFDRFAGIKQTVIGEGTHFMIPWVQRPIMFDIRWVGFSVLAVLVELFIENKVHQV